MSQPASEISLHSLTRDEASAVEGIAKALEKSTVKLLVLAQMLIS